MSSHPQKTAYGNSKQVGQYIFGKGSLTQLDSLLEPRRQEPTDYVVYILDHYFIDHALPLYRRDQDLIFHFDSTHEPSTDDVDKLVSRIRAAKAHNPCAMVGVGGGCALDTTKAVANLLTNGGNAEDYQGWDLVKEPAIYKIGVPTLSGTGAEASRTCVMTNYKKNLKLGMNSHHTIYDQLILDAELTKTVPRDQYFFTGMDTFVHCIESLAGRHEHGMADAFSHEALRLCHEVFSSNDMMSDDHREKMMVASFLGGSSIANSFVGVVHPFSAGLSIVLGLHHCYANCIVMNVMEEFYPEETKIFHSYLIKQGIDLPRGLTEGLSEEQFQRLYDSTVIHEKPLMNALGDQYRDILTYEKVKGIFSRM